MPELISIESRLAVKKAAKLLLSGQVIAIPTDTIYGISASAQHFKAIKQLYHIKKRDINKPISICVRKVSDINLWGDTSHLKQELLHSLLPGAVTVLLRRKQALNSYLNPNSNLVGIRIPDCQFVQELTRLCNVPLALTSANLSTEPSALEVSEFSHLWPHLAAIFDGGPLGSVFSCRAGSTVVDLSEPGLFTINRAGIAFDETVAVLKSFNLKENI